MIEQLWYTLFQGTPRNFVWWEEFLAVIFFMLSAAVIIVVGLFVLVILLEVFAWFRRSGAWKVVLPFVATAVIITLLF